MTFIAGEKIQLIETDELLAKAIAPFHERSELALDFEGEWNLHRYGLHLCLIQISDGHSTLLIDPLRVKNLRPVWDILEDPSILKISHGCQSDLVLLDYRFRVHPKNVIDTQKAAQLLAFEATSLSGLLEMFKGTTKNTKVRVSNWNIRPLTDKMLLYAAGDVEHLIEISHILKQQLRDRGRYEWFTEECALLETVRYQKKENPHLELPGVNKLNPRQRGVLMKIYDLRESIAAELDKPAYHIIANPKLLELAETPPSTPGDWKRLTGVHSVVGRRSQDFHTAVQEGRKIPAEEPGARKWDLPPGMSKTSFRRLADKRMDLLIKVQEKINAEYDIALQILSTRTMKKLSYGESTWEELRRWQREIILSAAEALGVDLTPVRTTPGK